MSKQFVHYLLLCVFTLTPVMTSAQKYYAPGKVVYDVTSSDVSELSRVIDRASLLQKIYQNDSFEASIVLVVHEGAIPLFAKNNQHHYELMQRVKGLTLGDIIQFRLCEASANMQGLSKDDFDSVVQIVPMADAEIIELQNSGYAYLK